MDQRQSGPTFYASGRGETRLRYPRSLDSRIWQVHLCQRIYRVRQSCDLCKTRYNRLNTYLALLFALSASKGSRQVKGRTSRGLWSAWWKPTTYLSTDPAASRKAWRTKVYDAVHQRGITTISPRGDC